MDTERQTPKVEADAAAGAPSETDTPDTTTSSAEPSENDSPATAEGNDVAGELLADFVRSIELWISGIGGRTQAS